MGLDRRKMRNRRRYGYDSVGNFGARHRNKYAKPPEARVWCNAVNGYNEPCTLEAKHGGRHSFEWRR